VNHAGLGVRFSDVQWDVQWDMQLDVQLDVQWIDEDPCPDAKAGQANDSTAISADARPVPRARHCPAVELPRMVGNFDGIAAILGISMMSAGQQASRSAGQQASRPAGQQASRSAGQQIDRPAEVFQLWDVSATGISVEISASWELGAKASLLDTGASHPFDKSNHATGAPFISEDGASHWPRRTNTMVPTKIGGVGTFLVKAFARMS
jgi:hypothetical protein